MCSIVKNLYFSEKGVWHLISILKRLELFECKTKNFDPNCNSTFLELILFTMSVHIPYWKLRVKNYKVLACLIVVLTDEWP